MRRREEEKEGVREGQREERRKRKEGNEGDERRKMSKKDRSTCTNTLNGPFTFNAAFACFQLSDFFS